MVVTLEALCSFFFFTSTLVEVRNIVSGSEVKIQGTLL